MPLGILFYIFLEIVLYSVFISHFGFLDAVLFSIVSGALGLSIMVLQGRATLQSLQSSFSGRQLPGRQVLHRALVMLGGFLIFLPGLVSDIAGVLLILPGLRHLAVGGLSTWLKVKLAQGAFRAFGTQGFVWTSGAGFARPRRPASSQPSSFQNQEREVIEVEPLSIEVVPSPRQIRGDNRGEN